MNKTYILFIFIIFTSCRYFNVSPVNGITTKNVQSKPTVADITGLWEIDSTSYQYLRAKNYPFKKVTIAIDKNGTYETTVPNIMTESKFDFVPQYLNEVGKWKVEKDYDDKYWVLSLYSTKLDKSPINSSFNSNFNLYLRNEKLIIWVFIGDPDSGEYLLFNKK